MFAILVVWVRVMRGIVERVNIGFFMNSTLELFTYMDSMTGL